MFDRQDLHGSPSPHVSPVIKLVRLHGEQQGRASMAMTEALTAQSLAWLAANAWKCPVCDPGLLPVINKQIDTAFAPSSVHLCYSQEDQEQNC